LAHIADFRLGYVAYVLLLGYPVAYLLATLPLRIQIC
jgi:ABC-type spermidine/putrescine transport system permease subunit I